MAFDGLFCEACARELDKWADARVEKVFQSSQTCFFFNIYKDGTRANLIISASAAKPMLAVTTESVAHPDDPTSTCMLYRKHLQNGKLVKVEAIKNERTVRFSFDAADEMGYIRRKHIYAEMMGKRSNVLLTDGDDKIISAAYVSDVTGTGRRIMVGFPYELPESQNKLSAFDISEEDFLSLCKEKSGMAGSEFLLKNFLAFSPLTAREIAFRAFGDSDGEVNEKSGKALFYELEKLKNVFETEAFTPCAAYGEDGGIEYSYISLSQYENLYKLVNYESFSRLLADYFGRYEEAVNISKYAHELTRAVNNHISRVEKKLGLLKNDLADTADMEKVRIKGDVITANIYRIKQGDSSFTGIDYESGNEITVPLDVSLTPAKNAQKYYKKYAKKKRAAVALKEQIEISNAEYEYLRGVSGFIERSATPAELSEIRTELVEGGYIFEKINKNKKKKTPPARPLSFKTTDGLTVRVGRNNRQNDALTGGAERYEIWFHIKGFHGSHVILTPNMNEEPSARDYTEAAMLAAYYSEKRGSKNVSVDYTAVKNLKKPNGSAPGFVTYDKYFSAVVDANDPFLKK